MDDILKQLEGMMAKTREERASVDLLDSIVDNARSGERADQIKDRADRDLIKFLHTEYGERVAKHWQRPPLVQLLHGEYCMDAWPVVPEMPGIHSKEQVYEATISSALDNMLWDDVILFVLDMAEPKVFDRMWMRIRSYPKFIEEMEVSSPWLAQIYRPFRERMERKVMVEVWTDGPLGKQPGFEWYYLMLDKDDPAGGHDIQNRDKVFRIIHSFALVSLSYLSQSCEHAVEVVSNAPRTTRTSKTGKLKPWLRDDLPRIILVDPLQARKHGCIPTAEQASEAAKRKSPRPHQRRGHWRRLAEGARRIFIRPAWIGPVKWEYQNQTYRVIRHMEHMRDDERTKDRPEAAGKTM